MAIQDVYEHKDGGREGREAVANQARDFVRRYLVLTDTGDTPETDVLGDARLPQLGDGHPFNGSSTVQNVSARQRSEDPKVWDVVVEYSTVQDETDDEDPLQREEDVELDVTPEKVPAEADVDGNPIDTSAGHPVDPVPLIDDGRLTLVIVRNETFKTNLDALKFRRLKDKVNSEAWRGFPAGEVKISRISSRKVTEQGVTYARVRYTFEIREHQAPPELTPQVLFAWDLNLIDADYYDKDGNRFEDARGGFKSRPTKLDGNGNKLTAGADPQYRTFQVYGAIDFQAELGF